MTKTRYGCIGCMIAAVLISGCYKKDIQFGNDLAESFTQILQVDTVSLSMSTYVLDSFPTNIDTAMLIGGYTDPLLGKVAAKPFFQFTVPADISLTDDAVFDSLNMIIKLNHYYYGDTSKPVTLTVNELASPIEYSYNSQLFNTSSVAETASPLASRQFSVSPHRDDSLMLNLPYSKGKEFFDKMREKSADISTPDAFSAYFKGVSITAGANSSLVIGFNASTDSVVMRMYYHSTIPYPVKQFKDFSISPGSIHFQQIIADRKGLAVDPLTAGQKAIASGLTNYEGYTQPNTGLLLKISFPTLPNIRQLSSTVKLLKATLVLQTSENSYDDYRLKLPENLLLAETDATNAIGNYVYSSDGSSLVNASAAYDNIYDALPSYSFDVTSAVNGILMGTVSTEHGFFVLDHLPGSAGGINRGIFNDGSHSGTSSRLVLSLLTLKN